MVEFDYRKEKLRTGNVIFRPVAKAYLLKDGVDWIPQFFYVDSGADYTLIPFRLGKFLGLETIAEQKREVGGIGGMVDVRFARVPMKIVGQEFDCTVAWSQEEQVPFLLGREDVFERFDILFQQKKHKVHFFEPCD